MLNRRSLRIKAMQSMYAFKQSKQSDYHIALDLIKESFAPDLNSMDFQDKELLESNKKQAIKLFDEYYNADRILVGQDVPDVVQNTASEAVSYYKQLVKKDFQFFRKQMLSETEEIYHHYLRFLMLLLEFAEVSKNEYERQVEKKKKVLAVGELNLFQNQVIDRLTNSKSLQVDAIKLNIEWTKERDTVRQWFKEVIKKDEQYQEYSKISAPSFQDDKQILLHLVKNILFKQETLDRYWEEMDINWVENKSILKSMVQKTLKAITEEGADAEPKLVELSSNWEDDREFFEKLFSECIKNDDEYQQLISKKAKNWDVERIAATDRVILEMAICEMINFPSIPVKVTINEYIDISKVYSTPKSKQFVNGLLDVLAEELQNEGVIKKSGRGLIDNK